MLIRDVKVEGRQRHPSGGVSAKEMVIGLEGVELGADGKVRRKSKCACAVDFKVDDMNTKTKQRKAAKIIGVWQQRHRVTLHQHLLCSGP